MKIVFCAFIAVTFAVYIIRLANKSPEPEFAVRGILSGDKLGYLLSSLAFGSKKTCKGHGIGIRRIRTTLVSARKKIGMRISRGNAEQCEITYFNNYYCIEETLERIKAHRKAFKKLPHVGGVPRLYSFCELFVKSSGGVISRAALINAVKSYSHETPFTFAEIKELGAMLDLALCEYLAVYINKVVRMGEFITKGETDCARGYTDRELLRYDSYLYGRTKNEDKTLLPRQIAGSVDIHKRIGNFVFAAAGYNARIYAAVNSVHKKNAFMSDEFVCTLSPVYDILYGGDSTFSMLSDGTKYMYLQRISEIAKRRNMPETTLASEVLYRAENDGKDISGYILPAVKSRSAQRIFIAFTVCGWLALAAVCAFILPRFGWLYAVFALPVFLYAVRFICDKAANRTVLRRILPSYSVKTLNPDKHRTAVLIPCLVKSKDDIEGAYAQIATVAAANPQNIFYYCLMLDYPRSNAREDERDEELNKAVRSGYSRLGDIKERVCVLVRSRKRVSGEEYYQGYEKKRGAVLDFNRFVLSGEGDFAVKLGNAPKAAYAVTLDSDTLTCGCAELVGTIAHPYCRDTAVLSLCCKAAEKRSAYARLYAGETGPGRYRYSRADMLFDLFAAGSFTGKGIYNISLFSERTDGFFPDNRILSHDFIEGGVAGCYNTSVNASEDFPQTFSDGFAREQRWLRGDWQLLPYTMRHVKDKSGKRIKNPLGPVTVFAVIQNLILSVVPVSQMAVLVLSLFTGPHYTVIILAVLPQLLRAVFSLVSLLGYPKQTALEFCRCAFELTVLPAVALYKLYAIVITLYRLIVRRKLLEWSVFAHTKGKVSFLPNIITAIVFAAWAAVFRLNVFFYAVAAVFAAGSVLPRLLSAEQKESVPSDSLRFLLTDTAKKTFGYFAAQENMYRLPCDCYQEDNLKGWCARTSPTNIGMALVAYASAYELGIINKQRLIKYAGQIVTAVEKCEKYKGNLYNWYDCETLKVLPVRFVSTVDSGNFTAALCLMLAYAEGGLKDRIQKLIDNTDLSALYDGERKLFYIGYNDESKCNTDNHYDLLGSESTLTYLLACGYGKVEKDAYYNLDRHAVRYGGNVTVYAWTGGMFEYLMSRLFIAPPSGTLLRQVMRGAVRSQIRYGAARGDKIWGVSECRYAEFDDAGGNLYRAFGVPHIAHSEVPDNPPYAPYAAFLALPYCTEKEFLQSANALTELGGAGEWGYYESLCGTVPVKSYMTHHQGMIMAACANALKSDCICKKLQTLPEWRTAMLLCGEEPAYKAKKKRNFRISAEEKPLRDFGVYICKASHLSAVAAKNETQLSYAGKRILQGIHVLACGENECDLLSGDFVAGESAAWHVKNGKFISESQLMILPSPLSAAVTVKYRNISKKAATVKFVTFAEPVLARVEDYEAHPAYSRMFIVAGEGDGGKYMWARRKKDGVTVLHCVQADAEVSYSADKCALYGRGRGGRFGQNLNPLLSSEFTATVNPGETFCFTSCFSVIDSAEKADYTAKLISSPDYVARFGGAAKRLARAVPDEARGIASRLLRGEYRSVNLGGVDPGKPAVVTEITAADVNKLSDFLSGLRTLAETGFSFEAVFFMKKHNGEFSLCRNAVEREIDLSGLRAAGINVTALDCDGETYEYLRRATPAEYKPLKTGFADLMSKCSYIDWTADKAEIDNGGNYPIAVPGIVQKLGLGGYTKEGHYVIDLTSCEPPAPWCNIISDGRMGTVMSASGGGFTFAENSRQQKLTEWCNDPVNETVSEFVAIHCDGESFGVTKRPLFSEGAEYTAVHAFGYSDFYCTYKDLQVCMRVYIARDRGKKVYDITLYNNSDRSKTVGALFAVCPVLGDFPRNTVHSHIYQPVEGGLYIKCGATGMETYLYGSEKTVVAGAETDGGLTLYKNTDGVRYKGIVSQIKVPPRERRKLRFALSLFAPEPFDCENELREVTAFYNRLNKITLDGEYGNLSKWLPYQIYNSRFAARTGFYQVSGAFGFRDQLQDCLALVYSLPVVVRRHILDCASHQFKEGDVQHWWHPPATGVRTHVCDDRLWLVYTVCDYISVTGDSGILSESVRFLADVPISPQDASVYTSAEFSAVRDSLFNHCLRAIKISCDFGENGLVRIRGGDWNDAMDKAGEAGIGTSVWCTMFLYCVINEFLPYVKDIDICSQLREISRNIYDAVCACYRSDRFLRAFTDNGTELGTENSPACKTDLLTQSWSVISGIGTAEQKRSALAAAYNALCDGENKIIRLFDPPFTSSEGVGYIGDYPEYVRENGGQYTQAAVWYVWALFKSGNTELANKLLEWLNPATHTKTPGGVNKYCVEPYVTAADVYGGDKAGKGGWTWYSGSGAWLYKCIINQYAGITVKGDTVTFCPKLPRDTLELNVTFTFGSDKIKVKIVNSQSGGEWRVKIGGVVYNTPTLKLTQSLAGKNIAVIRLPK